MAIKRFLLPVLGLALAGCAGPGLLYTKITKPYSDDFDRTPVGTKSCALKGYTIKEPISRYRVSAAWDTSAIVTEARKAGLTEIYFIDEQTTSVLMGIYSRKKFIVYGD